MSIQYCVAATLSRGSIEEANYRLLQDPEVHRLIGVTTLEEDHGFTDAYPRSKAREVSVTLRRRRNQDAPPARRDPRHARSHPPAIPLRHRKSTGRSGQCQGRRDGGRDRNATDVGKLCELLALPQYNIYEKTSNADRRRVDRSASGEWFESVNPFTAAPWALIPRGSKARCRPRR